MEGRDELSLDRAIPKRFSVEVVNVRIEEADAIPTTHSDHAIPINPLSRYALPHRAQRGTSSGPAAAQNEPADSTHGDGNHHRPRRHPA